MDHPHSLVARPSPGRWHGGSAAGLWSSRLAGDAGPAGRREGKRGENLGHKPAMTGKMDFLIEYYHFMEIHGG